MKILTIADVHGRDLWKHMIDKEGPDSVVFLGDYVDSFDVPWDKQLHNLMDIAEYKRGRGINCTLLTGNHDLPYLGGGTGVSGYQDLYASHYESVFWDLLNEKLLDVCYTLDNYLFVHAGMTKQWCKQYDIDPANPKQANELLYTNIKALEFQAPTVRYSYSPYGDNVWQSPTWVRPMSLKQGGIDSWNQVVGHTQHKKLTIEELWGNKYYFCDTQDQSGEYLVFIDGVPEIHTL